MNTKYIAFASPCIALGSSNGSPSLEQLLIVAVASIVVFVILWMKHRIIAEEAKKLKELGAQGLD